MVRARLLEHIVKQAATASRGASRALAVWGSDEGLVGVLHFPLSTLVRWDRLLSFLPPLLFLGGGLGLAAVALCGRVFLALVCLAVKDGTNCLLAGGIVGGGVEQLVGVGGTAFAQSRAPGSCTSCLRVRR